MKEIIMPWFILSFLLVFVVSQSPLLAEGAKIAILGESYSQENEQFGINVDVLERLFKLINSQKPKAVIFMGNMTLGLKRENHLLVSPTSKPFLDGSELHEWPYPGYTYDSSYFQKGITEFATIKNRTLSSTIPFFPLIAEHEAFGSDATSNVLTTLNLKSTAPSEASALAYTFAIDDALFILFSTAAYNDTLKTTLSHQLPPALFIWLEEILKKEKNNYKFIFVVGNEPAFSTTMSTGHYQGLDYNEKDRDIFWRLLINYGVTAYFCAKEHLYDRTNRYGIWQIISGGAGAPFYKRQFDKAFYHYLLLKLPEKGDTYPKVQVFDAQGNLNDEFELIPAKYPVYQLRIS